MKSRRARSPTKKSRSSVQRTKPLLWEKVKREVLRGSQGGPPGKWSARKAQLSVARYKSRGGGYRGKKSTSNSLTKWSREQWGYVGGSKGRYLPLVVRKHMSSRAKVEENRRKGSKRGQWVPYGKETTKLMRRFKIV